MSALPELLDCAKLARELGVTRTVPRVIVPLGTAERRAGDAQVAHGGRA